MRFWLLQVTCGTILRACTFCHLLFITFANDLLMLWILTGCELHENNRKRMAIKNPFSVVFFENNRKRMANIYYTLIYLSPLTGTTAILSPIVAARWKLSLHFFHILITHYHCMAKQICMIAKHSMKSMQCAEIHALPYEYNVPLSI